MVDEPKQDVAVEEFDMDKTVDNFLDGKQAEETPSESSTEKQTEEAETEEPKDAGDDQSKKSDSEEPKEDADPRDLAFRKGYNEAKSKFEGKEQLSVEEIAEFRKTTTSPSYIRHKMQADGYKDEAIDAKLTELGHNVPDRPQGSDFDLVMQATGTDAASLTPESKGTINDIIKVASVLLENKLARQLPTHLQPLQKSVQEMSQSQAGKQMNQEIRSTVENEGILDFKTDVEPALLDYIDKNPDARQEDVRDHFNSLNHSLVLQRVSAGKGKAGRDAKKGQLRTDTPSNNVDKSKAPKMQEGQTYDDYLDTLMDHHNIN